MKKCIISLVLVMVMFLSVSAYASGVELTDDEMRCKIGLTLEEKLIMKASWGVIDTVKNYASVWYSGACVVVEFDFNIYEDVSPVDMKKHLTVVAEAFQFTDSRIVKVFYVDSRGKFIGHANKTSDVFLW